MIEQECNALIEDFNKAQERRATLFRLALDTLKWSTEIEKAAANLDQECNDRLSELGEW